MSHFNPLIRHSRTLICLFGLWRFGAIAVPLDREMNSETALLVFPVCIWRTPYQAWTAFNPGEGCTIGCTDSL